jgi:hypothetical protein
VISRSRAASLRLDTRCQAIHCPVLCRAVPPPGRSSCFILRIGNLLAVFLSCCRPLSSDRVLRGRYFGAAPEQRPLRRRDCWQILDDHRKVGSIYTLVLDQLTDPARLVSYQAQRSFKFWKTFVEIF